ncbi:MAG: hypothetical protein BRD47_02665 [Bacteroidetes bacterium QS_8_68_28]|nr:MAG: hypothetical protein BRD47_02665 [Bacteroidetes bacterium QS_8_68_28]
MHHEARLQAVRRTHEHFLNGPALLSAVVGHAARPVAGTQQPLAEEVERVDARQVKLLPAHPLLGLDEALGAPAALRIAVDEKRIARVGDRVGERLVDLVEVLLVFLGDEGLRGAAGQQQGDERGAGDESGEKAARHGSGPGRVRHGFGEREKTDAPPTCAWRKCFRERRMQSGFYDTIKACL